MQLDLSTEGKAVIFSEDAERVDAAVKLVRELVHEIVEVCMSCQRSVGGNRGASEQYGPLEEAPAALFVFAFVD